MNATMRWARALAFAPLFATVTLLAACDDDPTDEDEDPAELITSIHLTVGASNVTLNTSGAVTAGGPIVIPPGVTAVSATFLDAGGQSLNPVLGDFEMRITPDNTGLLTFARTGAFAGSFTRVAAGSTSFKFGLWHTEEGHFDLGEWAVAVTVQ